MRIGYLCNEYPPTPHGGIGSVTRTLARAMVRAGHEVVVLGFGQTREERNDHGVRVLTIRECKVRRLAWLINRLQLHVWLRARAIVNELDIVETPEYGGLLPFKFNYCPTVVRLHMSGTAILSQALFPTNRILEWCERNTLRHHENWIGVSRYILEQTKNCFSIEPKQSAVIYNPVTLDCCTASVPLELPKYYILFAGTVSERKGAVVLAEACRGLLKRRDSLHLVFAGAIETVNGERTDEKILAILGDHLKTRVHFLGRIEHGMALAIMRRATLVACPSRLEAFGLVPLEAMACRTPVVYSKIPPAYEIIDDGVTGILVDPYNPLDTEIGMLRILDDPLFAERLVVRAAKVVKERFSAERCVLETEAFYKKCMNCSGGTD